METPKMREWVVDALCAEVGSGLFFPGEGGSASSARKVCGLCTVREECLEWALDNGERYGVFGGLTERARAKLARERKAS